MSKIIAPNDVHFLSGAMVGAFKGAAKNVPNNLYHSLSEYWSSTDLKFMQDHSPEHFYANYFGELKGASKKETEAMTLGSLVHCLILTPEEYAKEFFVMPELNLRTAEGREQKAHLIAINEGKKGVTQELLDRAHKMRVSCLSHKKASDLLNIEHKELSFFWTCPFSSLNFKAKLDAASSKHFIELKTTNSASPDTFSRYAYDRNYDLSIVHYRQGIKSAFDIEPPAYFIAIENEAPYVTEVYKVGDGFLETGHQKWLSAVTKLADGIQKNKWPGYYAADDISELQPPRWATKGVNNEQ